MVFPLRFDTPPKHGQLKAAAIASRIPFLIDLETWRLPYLENHRDDSFGTDAATVVAQAVPLPLIPAALRSESALQALVRAGLTAQAGAAEIFAPDFQFDSLTDEWLEVNLRSLRMTQALSGGRPVSAWIHITLRTLESGILPHAAERYRRELPANSTVVLTVSDLRMDLPPDLIATYLQGLQAFREAGLGVVVDRASELSIPAIAGGAIGSMLGNRIYRTAPASPKFELPFNPAVKLKYFVGSQARQVSRVLAKKRHLKGKLSACQWEGCEAIDADDSRNLEVRLHNAHELKSTLREAKRKGFPALIEEWKNAPLKHLREWAQALERVISRRKEA